MKTGAVVVAYYPDSGFLGRLSKISAGVDFVVCVDNTPNGSQVVIDATPLLANVYLLGNERNLGIAIALNQGVSKVQEFGAERIFLFDQDSEPAAAIFSRLSLVMDNLQSKGTQVGLVGPAYFDTRLNEKAPFIRLDGLKIHRLLAEGFEPIEAEYLITSGSCIDAIVWQDVGGMDETLFIREFKK